MSLRAQKMYRAIRPHAARGQRIAGGAAQTETPPYHRRPARVRTTIAHAPPLYAWAPRIARSTHSLAPLTVQAARMLSHYSFAFSFFSTFGLHLAKLAFCLYFLLSMLASCISRFSYLLSVSSREPSFSGAKSA